VGVPYLHQDTSPIVVLLLGSRDEGHIWLAPQYNFVH
jgi:hypothetical protein